jgi:P-type E1-E2 ATPase
MHAKRKYVCLRRCSHKGTTLRAGKGIRATLNGVELLLGSPSFVQEACGEGALTAAAQLVPAEQSLVCIAADGVLWAVVGLVDGVRPEAAGVVRCLASMGVHAWIASGDRTATVATLAAALGIPPERARGGLQPADKAALVTALQEDGSRVAMVGDGINDAVALTAADVGIAFGSGAAVVMDCADVVVKACDLGLLVTLIDLAAAARTRILSNFGWAAVYNVIAMPVAAGVLFPATGRVTIPPAFAGLSELLSSVPVVLGSLLLYRFQARTTR